MTGRQHSIVPHKANYFFIPLEDDYLAMYEDMAQVLDPIKEANEEKLSGPSDCKGMIASVLEAWMNSKRPAAKCDDDLYVYLTYDEWEQALRYRYKRSTIIQCLKEMEAEGEYLDETGKYGKPDALYKGTIKKRHFVQNTFEYQLNLPVILALLDKLPEQSPFEQKSRPSLGRPHKSRVKINGLNKNGLNLDDRDVKTNDGSVKIDDSRVKINAPFYTQTSYTKQTYTEGTEASANASPTPTQLTQIGHHLQIEQLIEETNTTPESDNHSHIATPTTGDTDGHTNNAAADRRDAGVPAGSDSGVASGYPQRDSAGDRGTAPAQQHSAAGTDTAHSAGHATNSDGTTRARTPRDGVASQSAAASDGYEKAEQATLAAPAPVSAKVEPQAAQEALIERPATPEMPLTTARWCAETAVLVSEALRRKYYTPAQRTNQVANARRMFRDFPDIARAPFEEIFIDWAQWWRDHDKGIFTLADLLARGQNREVRLQTALDRLEARTLVSKPKRSTPKHIPTREEDPYSIAALIEQSNPGYFARMEELAHGQI